MSNLIFLLVIYIAFLLLALFLSKGELSSPSVLFFASFCLMLLLANIYQWYFDYEIKNSTFGLIMGSGATFIIVEYTYKWVHKSSYRIRKKPASFAHEEEKAPILISKPIQYCMVAFFLLIIAVEYYRIIIYTDGGTWRERMRQYVVAARSLNYESPSPLLDFFIGQLIKMGRALVHVILYIVLINKIKCKTQLRQEGLLILLLLLYIPLSLFQGVRQPIFELIMSGILMFFILKKVDNSHIHIVKLAFFSITFISVFIPLFAYFASIVGRADIERDAMQYIATYFSGGLKNFDELIVGHPNSTKYFGQSTFSGMYSFLIDKFHILPVEEDLSYHAFGFFDDTSITTFGRWYEDFGGVGVFFMTALVSFFFSWLHNRAERRRAPNLTHIIYAHQANALILAAYDDRISPLMTFNNLITILLMVIFFRFFIGGGKYRFTFGGKRIHFNIGGSNHDIHRHGRSRFYRELRGSDTE